MGPWERLFVWASRAFGWIVLLVPLAVVGVLVGAAIAGHQRADIAGFATNLGGELLATVAVGVAGALIGSSIGIGTALLTHELAAGLAGRAIGLLAAGLGLFPAVVLGWFGATLVLPAFFPHSSAAVFGAACLVVSLAVIPRSNRLAIQTLGAIPPDLREAATAAGANASRLTAHVLLPASKVALLAIYRDALSRSTGEAAAVSIVFLAAARAGYPISPFTIGGSMIAQAHTVQVIDAGIAQAALLLVALAVAAKMSAIRQMRDLRWVL